MSSVTFGKFEKQYAIKCHLIDLMNNCNEQLDILFVIFKQALFLLWWYVRFYTVDVAAQDREVRSGTKFGTSETFAETSVEFLNRSSLNVRSTSENIKQLKQNLSLNLDVTFIADMEQAAKILAAAAGHSPDSINFSTLMIQELKRLICHLTT
ncbi:unnamed protein product [Soboliphyme baturini]|uniref:Uncharacterized protein n=1 Tax=Soboliphyme baturini TaxID=241478 RepID=A0A183IDY2_9BILA|nr:unnamed protein product [Soboliphyme baturini]